MPTYLLHLTGDGTPVGAYTQDHDYYVPEFDHLRAEGQEIVFGKLPTVPWAQFIEHLADTLPSRTMRWDTYHDPSSNLQSALEHARRDLEVTGEPEPE
jgi:hypothetical protein